MKGFVLGLALGALLGVVGGVPLLLFQPAAPVVETPAGPCPLPTQVGERLIITVTKIEEVFYRECTFVPRPYRFRRDGRAVAVK